MTEILIASMNVGVAVLVTREMYLGRMKKEMLTKVMVGLNVVCAILLFATFLVVA